MARAPSPKMAQSKARPGCGSATRAGPTGIRGDSAVATTTAMAAPMATVTPTSANPTAPSWARVTPSARSVGWSAEATKAWRARIWPMISRAVSATSSANNARATAWGWMACSTLAAC